VTATVPVLFLQLMSPLCPQVVDARAGPGTKSITKMKMKQKEEKKAKKKHKHHRAIHPSKPPQSPSGLSDDIVSKSHTRL